MSGHVKNLKVPHQWGEVGQSFIQVQWDWIIPDSRTTYIFKTTPFTASSLGETKPCIRNILPTHTHRHITAHSPVKKCNYWVYLSQRIAYNLSYASYYLTSRYPSLGFPLFAEAVRSIPTSRCQKPPITPRQDVLWRFVRRREFWRT